MASVDKDLLKKTLEAPVELPSNTYLHFYNGGKLRAEFMGEPNPRDDYRSEEWIFSTNRAITPGRDNPPDKGISRVRLASGQVMLITDLLEAFPEECLGRRHIEKHGGKLGVLVKIFDVGDGAHIPVHWHPSPEFSRRHLNSPYGKNECWIVIGTRPGAKAWVGWKEDVGEARFREWMEAQDVAAMRAHLHEITPKVGDIIFLRDGYVHSLGSGLCVLEPQEPSDWNILAEWEGYPYGKEDAHCGLGWDLALKAAKFDSMPLEYLNGYVRRRASVLRTRSGAREETVLPEEARQFFWFTRIEVPPRLSLDLPGGRGFYCLIGVQGQGELRGPFGRRPIARGKSYFIPASLPGFEVAGTGERPLEVYCCFPPAT
jgi:mannose-6-phosphate isomerase